MAICFYPNYKTGSVFLNSGMQNRFCILGASFHFRVHRSSFIILHSMSSPFIVILGIAQDGGVPHVGTASPAWEDPALRRYAASLAIVDPESNERWMVEATPDFKEQLHRLNVVCSDAGMNVGLPDGIAVTHAHVGHYLGLGFLGKEMLDTTALPVLTMPRMKCFLEENLPWSLLVRRKNIVLQPLQANAPHTLNSRLALVPLPVPHRDEYSETVGFKIEGPNRSVLFIPDIDRWEDWDAWGQSIEEQIANVDVALLDGTFFDERELPGRDMTQIPHPTVKSSLQRFKDLPADERRKIRFIHLNHSNPLLDPQSDERQTVERAGFGVAKEMEIFEI